MDLDHETDVQLSKQRHALLTLSHSAVQRATLLLSAFSILACGPVSSQPPQFPAGPVADRPGDVVQQDAARLIAFRRDLHRNPEVSGNEKRTAQLIAAELRRLGIADVRTGVGGHGVVGVVRGRLSGPTVAYRADMDAVPSSAPDPVDFPSLNPGIRHICGHDIHVTVGIALAAILQSLRDSLSGNVMFVFQPAEERATGANAMLADNVFGSDQPIAVYGLHTAPYETGVLGVAPGPMMGGRDRFTVTLSGNGDLSGATNAVSAALQSLATVPSGQTFSNQPIDFIALTLSPPQTSAGQVTIAGNVSVASASSRARVRNLVTNGLASIVPTGVGVNGSYEARFVAGVTNDTALTTRAVAAIQSTLGEPSVRLVTSIVPAFSEDFGSFQNVVPGVFFFLGVSNAAKGWVGMPHTAGYVADEAAIGIGARAMAAVLLERLGTP